LRPHIVGFNDIDESRDDTADRAAKDQINKSNGV
jgi:hypothetical protein